MPLHLCLITKRMFVVRAWPNAVLTMGVCFYCDTVAFFNEER
jgi:hypothetical protein